MNVVIVGGGKIGFYLAETLLNHGHHPHVVEIDKRTCAHLADALDIPIICGDGTTIEALESAEVAGADALISVSGRDEDNLISCQLAKMKFGVKKTVARVNNPRNLRVMKKLGVDVPVCTTNNIVRVIEHEADNAQIKLLMSLNAGAASLNEIVIPDHFPKAGQTLAEIGLSKDVVVVTITRGEEMLIPRGETTLESGDKVMVIAKNHSLHDINELFGG